MFTFLINCLKKNKFIYFNYFTAVFFYFTWNILWSMFLSVCWLYFSCCFYSFSSSSKSNNKCKCWANKSVSSPIDHRWPSLIEPCILSWVELTDRPTDRPTERRNVNKSNQWGVKTSLSFRVSNPTRKEGVIKGNGLCNWMLLARRGNSGGNSLVR